MVRSDLPGALVSAAFDPPWPSLPWQGSHFCAKIAAPWAGVPLPGGNPLPSGPTLMSQSARSASLTGLPSPGRSAAVAAADKPSTSASEMARRLPVDMLGLPIAVDGPAGDDVHVPHREGGHRNVDLRSATLGEHLLARGLNIAGLVPGAALQHDRLAVPAPGQAEAGQGLGEHRRIERGLGPALAGVGRDHDLLDPSIARIGEAGNLVEARSLEGQPGRGVGDE